MECPNRCGQQLQNWYLRTTIDNKDRFEPQGLYCKKCKSFFEPRLVQISPKAGEQYGIDPLEIKIEKTKRGK